MSSDSVPIPDVTSSSDTNNNMTVTSTNMINGNVTNSSLRSQPLPANHYLNLTRKSEQTQTQSQTQTGQSQSQQQNRNHLWTNRRPTFNAPFTNTKKYYQTIYHYLLSNGNYKSSPHFWPGPPSSSDSQENGNHPDPPSTQSTTTSSSSSSSSPNNPHHQTPTLLPDPSTLHTDYRHARLHLYSMCLTFGLWTKPHYRAPSYAQDMRDNLKNLAFPGTFLPLSMWLSLGDGVIGRLFALVFVLVVYPILCLVSALITLFVERDSSLDFLFRPIERWFYRAKWSVRTMSILGPHQGLQKVYECCSIWSKTTVQWLQRMLQPNDPQLQSYFKFLIDSIRLFITRWLLLYQITLLKPSDWFSYWRLNCTLAAYHCLLSSEGESSESDIGEVYGFPSVHDDYQMENKWDFLVKAHEKGVQVTPCFGLDGKKTKTQRSQSQSQSQRVEKTQYQSQQTNPNSINTTAVGPLPVGSPLTQQMPLTSRSINRSSRPSFNDRSSQSQINQSGNNDNNVGRDGSSTDHLQDNLSSEDQVQQFSQPGSQNTSGTLSNYTNYLSNSNSNTSVPSYCRRINSLKIDTLIAKNMNIEGGMGIKFFKNASQGGEWILQPKLENSRSIKHLLPRDCPLSTLRVLTASSLGLPSKLQQKEGRIGELGSSRNQCRNNMNLESPGESSMTSLNNINNTTQTLMSDGNETPPRNSNSNDDSPSGSAGANNSMNYPASVASQSQTTSQTVQRFSIYTQQDENSPSAQTQNQSQSQNLNMNLKQLSSISDNLSEEKIATNNINNNTVAQQSQSSESSALPPSQHPELTQQSQGVVIPGISTLTCVFRAGRQGSLTDHRAIFYNVQLEDSNSSSSSSSNTNSQTNSQKSRPQPGTITYGSLNSHWYEVGFKNFWNALEGILYMIYNFVFGLVMVYPQDLQAVNTNSSGRTTSQSRSSMPGAAPVTTSNSSTAVSRIQQTQQGQKVSVPPVPIPQRNSFQDLKQSQSLLKKPMKPIKDSFYTSILSKPNGFSRRMTAISHHPDTNLQMIGKKIPVIQEIRELCERAHFQLCPSVPLAG